MGKKRRNEKRQEATANTKNEAVLSGVLNEPSEPSEPSGPNGVSALVVSGSGGSTIALEDVQKVLEGLGFEKAGDIPGEMILPNVIQGGKNEVVGLVVGRTDNCKVLSALLYDTPDKLDPYYMRHPDKYVFKNGDDKINLFQMAAYFGATCTAKWLLDTKKFDVDSVSVTDSGKNAVWYALRFYGEGRGLFNFKDEDITNKKWIDKKSKVLSFLLKNKDDGGAGASLNFAPVECCCASGDGDGNDNMIWDAWDAWDAFFDLYNYLKSNSLEVKAYSFVNSMLSWEKNNIENSSLCSLGKVDDLGNAVPHYERFLNKEGGFYQSCRQRVLDLLSKKIINAEYNLSQHVKDGSVLRQKLKSVEDENSLLKSEKARLLLISEEEGQGANKKSDCDLKSVTKKNDALQGELEIALLKIEELSALNKDQKEELGSKSNDVGKLSSENKILNAKTGRYLCELSKESDSNKLLRAKIDDLTQRSEKESSLILENASLNIKNKDYQDQIESLVDKLSSSERSLSISQMALDSEKEKTTALEAEKAELYKQVESLQEINSSKSQEISKVQYYSEHLNIELYNIQQYISTVNQENSRLVQELSSSNSSLAQIENIYGSRISSLMNELATLKANVGLGGIDKDKKQNSNTLVEAKSCLVVSENLTSGASHGNNSNIEVGSSF